MKLTFGVANQGRVARVVVSQGTSPGQCVAPESGSLDIEIKPQKR
jgi:hypothetical protein